VTKVWNSWPSIKSKPLNLEFTIPTDKIHKFWNYLEAGEFRTTRCKSCGSLTFPPVGDCVKCTDSDIEWVELDGRGEVVAFTHVIARPVSFQEHPPYTIVIVDLVECLKVLAWMERSEITEVKVGMDVRLVAGMTVDGEPSYWFVPR
jgi:uncharacterized OB-fold protein|tara:strand:+ start:1688 stop:2128 length:441 start_codon:yes stop_codon:yes gene_type:complete